MGTIVGKINLAQLTHMMEEVEGQNGPVECMIIPIKNNNLFKSEKGNVFLDVICFEKDGKYDDTHLIKQSLPKEVREKMSDQEQKDMPILGNLNVNFGGGEQKPKRVEGELKVKKKAPF